MTRDDDKVPFITGDTEYQFSAHGYTICTVEPLTDDEKEALTAYLSLLRKAQDRKRGGITDLDQP